MIILGLNAYHGDSSACIIVDGKLIAAAEEERFSITENLDNPYIYPAPCQNAPTFGRG